MTTTATHPDPFHPDNLRVKPEDVEAWSRVRRTARRHRTYEYHVAEVDHPMSAGTLDAIGEKGWRLAGVVRHGGLITYSFLRPTRRSGS
jgi:hypothetical protein